VAAPRALGRAVAEGADCSEGEPRVGEHSDGSQDDADGTGRSLGEPDGQNGSVKGHHEGEEAVGRGEEGHNVREEQRGERSADEVRDAGVGKVEQAPRPQQQCRLGAAAREQQRNEHQQDGDEVRRVGATGDEDRL
jgi:hypothetical protein